MQFAKSLLILSVLAGASLVGRSQDAASSDSKPAPATDTVKDSAGKKTVGLANPASVNCEKKGGKLEIRKGKKGEYGVCKFPNGKECEEWAFLRGKCSPDAQTPPQGEKPPADAPPPK